MKSDVSGSYIHLSLSGLGETNQKHWSLPFDIIQYLQSVFVFRLSKYKPCCKNSNFVFFSADFAFCKLWLKASASSFLIFLLFCIKPIECFVILLFFGVSFFLKSFLRECMLFWDFSGPFMGMQTHISFPDIGHHTFSATKRLHLTRSVHKTTTFSPSVTASLGGFICLLFPHNPCRLS